MRRALLALAFVLQSALAYAGCSTGALPFQLQNNTIADATQVMANFNQIITGVQANCAAAGANLDITSLGALATPLSPAQGGTQTFYGGTSSGVNTIVIGTTVPTTFTLQTGIHVVFIAGATSTATATLQVSTAPAKNLFRRTQNGIAATQGGEVILGNNYSAIYDGTEFIIENELVIVGEMKDYVGGVAAPPGWFIADGSPVSQTTFPQLFSLVGFAFGNPGGGNFNLPDTRGRILAGLDNYGTSTGAANRLTSVVTGCGVNFTAIGANCSNVGQNHLIAQSELPNIAPAFTGTTQTWTSNQSNIDLGVNNITVATGGTATLNTTGSITVTVTPAGTVASINGNVTEVAHTLVNPNLGVIKIIRF